MTDSMTDSALYTVAEIRAIEGAAAAALPPGTLMQQAGQAVARAAWKLLPEPRAAARILVLAGPGDNGGDAREPRACLAQAGAGVSVLLYASSSASADARTALTRAR